MLSMKRRLQAARAELRRACCVTAVQQLHAQAAAVLARHEGSQATANMGEPRLGGRRWLGGGLCGLWAAQNRVGAQPLIQANA